jgi:parvulin-like peptidyl-prolyl isomerase
MLGKFFREPLLHFVVLGALLFALYAALNPGVSGEAKEIVVTQGQLDNLKAQFERTWQRAPGADEMDQLLEQWVRDEIYYRDGLAMGLDRDDPVVRRRIAQKLEFVADGQAATLPTDADLQAWLDQHADRYRIEPRYTLRQLYFDPARRGNRLEADLAAALAALQGGQSAQGDATLLPGELIDAPAFEVARAFGSEFADALKTAAVAGWVGPLRSGYGFHLVDLRARDEGRAASLAEVRAEVERDWLRARSEEASAAFYRKLRAGYTVRIDAARANAPG